MLRRIAVFSMQGRWSAAISIALCSIAALILPPMSYLASGVIALCTLSKGPREGVFIVAAATTIFALIAAVLLHQLLAVGILLLTSWLPVLGITLVLGYTRSLAMSLLAASGLGVVLVLGAYSVLPDPATYWYELMLPVFDLIGEQSGWQLDQTQTTALMTNLSNMMTGLIAAGLTINAMIGLLIGRAWQASLYNPGGFAKEFYQLRLGKPAALLTVALMVFTALPLGDSVLLLRECLLVVLSVFAVQGLAVVHAIVHQQKRRSFWLVAIYVLLILMMPQMVVLLAMTGVLEQWFNFRRHSSE